MEILVYKKLPEIAKSHGRWLIACIANNSSAINTKSLSFLILSIPCTDRKDTNGKQIYTAENVRQFKIVLSVL